MGIRYSVFTISLLFFHVVTAYCQTFSTTYDISFGDGDIYKTMVPDSDTVYAISAHGCDGECYSVVKLTHDGTLLKSRRVAWMDVGDKDAIFKDSSKIVICGSHSDTSNSYLDILVLDTQLDSLMANSIVLPDSFLNVGARSVFRYHEQYLVIGMGILADDTSDPGLVYWLDRKHLSLDFITSVQFGNIWTAFTQGFTTDSSVIMSVQFDSTHVFFKRGFVELSGYDTVSLTWESDGDSGLAERGEDALKLANSDLIIEHSVDNSHIEFELICIGQDGQIKWEYDSPYHPFGRKLLLHLGQAINGDIIGCGKIWWPWDPEDTGPNGGAGYSGGYIFRMNSENGEMIWEQAMVGYDDQGNFAGDFFADIEELPDGSILLCGGWKIYDSEVLASYNSWLVRTDSAGCIIADCEFPAYTTSTIDLQEDGFKSGIVMKCWPNPAKSIINVEVEGNWYGQKDLSIGVYNTAGIPIINIPYFSSPESIDLGDVPSGVYFVFLTENSGRILQVIKVLKL